MLVFYIVQHHAKLAFGTLKGDEHQVIFVVAADTNY